MGANTPILIICENCGKDFVPQIREEPTEDQGIVMKHACPHCKHEYGVVQISEKGLRLRERIQARRGSGLNVSETALEEFASECRILTDVGES